MSAKFSNWTAIPARRSSSLRNAGQVSPPTAQVANGNEILLPDDRLVVGVVEEVKDNEIRVNTGELMPRFLPLKEGRQNQGRPLIKGELLEETGTLILRPDNFLTGSGRQDTDRMRYAGSPLDILRYMMLGRRKARQYLAKRGKPWKRSGGPVQTVSPNWNAPGLVRPMISPG